MLRQVRGLGKLVLEEIRWVTSETNGRVEKKLLEAGARVSPDTVLIELSNPQLELEFRLRCASLKAGLSICRKSVSSNNPLR